MITAKKPRRPDPVKVGRTVIPIYRRPDGAFTARYFIAGRAYRLTRRKLAELRVEAERIGRGIESGVAQAGELSAADAQEYVHARSRLAPGDPPLHVIVEQWRADRQREAAASSLPARTVAEVRVELLAAKARLGLSERYGRTLDKDLAAFAAAFPQRPIAGVRGPEIGTWLDGLRARPRSDEARAAARPGAPVAWRRRNNVRDTLVTLFRFAASRGYLSEGRQTEPERIPKVIRPRDAAPPGVLTPEEMRAVLGRVREKFLPWAVLGACAGLRAEEIQRMRWEHVHLDDGVIEITEEVAKRTSRTQGDARFVEMSDNLRAWLAPWRGCTGPVCPSRPELETRRLKAVLPGGAWPRNGLRHGGLSCQAALTGNLAATAEMAGNSTQVARRNYRRPMMRRAAVTWFGIFPEGERPAKVLPLFGGETGAPAARRLV